MNNTEFRYIKTHIRFLQRHCNGNGIHPFDVDDVWLMRESLAHLGICELDQEKLNFMEVATAIHELDALLGVVIIGGTGENE